MCSSDRRHSLRAPPALRSRETGWREETEDLYQKLKPYGLLQFVRSGRISVSKEPMNISNILGLNSDK